MLFSIIAGVIMGAIGFVITPYSLELMGIKDEIFESSVLYMRIIMLELPASAVYNFGSSIIRSVGDSRTPLIILTVSGALNVLLNLLFVIVFGMAVDGVAIATIISQYASAAAVFYVLIARKNESYAISLGKLKMNSRLLKRMLLIGVPSGIQGSIFSIANASIMSAVNTFPTTVISAYSISDNIMGFNYTAMNCFNQACTTFTGQNYGANKNDRIRKTLLYSAIHVVFIGVLVGQTELLFGRELSMLYISADDPNKAAVVESAMELMRLMLSVHFLCGLMEVISGALVGLGRSIVPMVLSIAGVCGLRILWVYAVFFPIDSMDTITELMMCVPISWAVTIVAHFTTLMIYWKKKGIWNKECENDKLDLQNCNI